MSRASLAGTAEVIVTSKKVMTARAERDLEGNSEHRPGRKIFDRRQRSSRRCSRKHAQRTQPQQAFQMVRGGARGALGRWLTRAGANWIVVPAARYDAGVHEGSCWGASAFAGSELTTVLAGRVRFMETNIADMASCVRRGRPLLVCALCTDTMLPPSVATSWLT